MATQNNFPEDINKQLNNVFSDMQQLVEDRVAGIRQTDSVYAFDENNIHSITAPCSFKIEGYEMTSIDHALTLLKAYHARDEGAVPLIGACYNNKAASLIKIHRFNSNSWKVYESRAMKLAINAKYSQNTELLMNLASTGTKKLVYTGTNTYTSCGLSLKSDNIFYPQFWTGSNMFGRLLSDFRTPF